MSANRAPAIERLRDAVQYNCDVGDARHAADFSLCVYLLKMREYYRWERGLALTAEMGQGEVGDWLRQREERWESLGEAEFSGLPLDQGEVSPFAADVVNRELNPLGLVYSAGFGHGARPHFVLAELDRHERHGEFEIYRCTRELARDLSAPPAMTQGHTIYLRLESIRRMIWEKVQEANWHAEGAPTHRLMAYYDFAVDPEQAMDHMSEELCRSILDHEIGEFRAGQSLGPEWEEMLLELAGTRAEIMLRAIRDLFADSLATLPGLLETGDLGGVHYYASNMSGMRRHLFPSFHGAYQEFAVSNDLAPLRELSPRAQPHWRQVCSQALEIYREQGAEGRPHIESMIEEHHL